MSPRRKNPLSMVLDASFVIGAVCTSIFYWIMLSPRMKGSMLSHYTTEHAVEYVVVALSFWGLVDIIRKLAGFPREFAALKQPWLPLSDGREEASHAAELLQTVRAHGGWTGKSRIARRYEEALTHVVESGSAAGFAERLGACQ